jgi:hypothetical protein
VVTKSAQAKQLMVGSRGRLHALLMHCISFLLPDGHQVGITTLLVHWCIIAKPFRIHNAAFGVAAQLVVPTRSC